MKLLNTLLFVFLISFIATAQQSKIDSLKIDLKTSKIDTSKARILKEIVVASTKVNFNLAKKNNDSLIEFSNGISDKYLAYGYRMKGAFLLMASDFENSIKFYQKSLELYKKLGDKKNEAKVLDALGTYYARKRDNKKALEYYDKSILINKSINNEEDNIITLVSFSMIKGNQEFDYQIAINYLTEALKIADKYNSKKRGLIHKQIATNYLLLDSYEKGKNHLKQALKFAEKQNDISLLSNIHGLYGYLYESEDDNFTKALFHYKEALKYEEINGSKLELINKNYNVGLNYSRLKKYKEAKKHFERGLSIAKQLKIKRETASGYYYLANHYALYNDNLNAIKYLNKANELVGGDSKVSFKNQFYRLGESFNKNGNYKEAYISMNTYAVLADSLFKKNSIEQISKVETKYQTEKKEKENLQLKADKAEQELLTQKANTRNWFLFLGLIAVGIISFVIWRRYKSEAKAKQIISTQKDTIENLQKELHHRVKNNLAIIDTFIEVAKEEFNDENIDAKLTEIQNRISSINEIHKQLYKSQDITSLNIKNYIDVLAKNIADSFSKKEILIKKNIENINLNADTSFPVGLIINEFLTNSYKYAFEEKGTINIEMKDQGENYILALSDNGKGLPNNFDINQIETFGLRIVKLLTKQLDGVFSLKSNNGVQLTVQIPKSIIN